MGTGDKYEENPSDEEDDVQDRDNAYRIANDLKDIGTTQFKAQRSSVPYASSSLRSAPRLSTDAAWPVLCSRTLTRQQPISRRHSSSYLAMLASRTSWRRPRSSKRRRAQ